jgi:hypothetical protein
MSKHGLYCDFTWARVSMLLQVRNSMLALCFFAFCKHRNRTHQVTAASSRVRVLKQRVQNSPTLTRQIQQQWKKWTPFRYSTWRKSITSIKFCQGSTSTYHISFGSICFSSRHSLVVFWHSLSQLPVGSLCWLLHHSQSTISHQQELIDYKLQTNFSTSP